MCPIGGEGEEVTCMKLVAQDLFLIMVAQDLSLMFVAQDLSLKTQESPQ